jgi:hypothetical protein
MDQVASELSFGTIQFSCNQLKKGEQMKDNRVLSRTHARELTQTEMDAVSGGFITFSRCTAAPSPDGDQHAGEAGC